MLKTITPERSALLLADASRFIGIGRALHAWPEEFSIDNLAALIAKGRNGDKKADFRLWRDGIAAAIHEKHLIPQIEKLPAVPARLIVTGGRGISPHSIHRQPERPERDLVSIARAAAAQWLDRISFDVDNHAHVRAWLQAGGIDCSEGGDGKVHPPSKREKLAQILNSMTALDRAAMPGQKIDFHALALAKFKEFQVAASTFSDYLEKAGKLPKLCTFIRGQRRNPDFYKAAGVSMGVKEADYLKALKELENQKTLRKIKKASRSREFLSP